MDIKILGVYGFKNAMVGMRYPKNSELLSDSSEAEIGTKDLELLLKLTKAGKDHRKALRMIHVQASVNMPISWWIQYDTYKVATVANSRSRMHKLGSRLLTQDDFYVVDWTGELDYVLNTLNSWIREWQRTNDMVLWHRIIDLMPMSYQQERMIDLNYETLITILNSRYSEKLSSEWLYFCDSFLQMCPELDVIWEVSR